LNPNAAACNMLSVAELRVTWVAVCVTFTAASYGGGGHAGDGGGGGGHGAALQVIGGGGIGFTHAFNVLTAIQLQLRA